MSAPTVTDAAARVECVAAIRRHQQEWRQLPLIDRAPAMVRRRLELSAAFCVFRGNRAAFVAAVRAHGASAFDLRELCLLYDAWRAGQWSGDGVAYLDLS